MFKFKGGLFLLGSILVGILLGVIFLTKVYPKASQNPRLLPPTVGSLVPDFNLPLLDGSSQRLSELRGKAVLINFWATWCPPCKEEMPLIQRYASRYKDQLIVLGVDSQENPDIVRNFIKDRGITFPILLDQSGRISDLYFTKNFPTSFFVDADGVLRGQHMGQLSEDLLVQFLKTIGL